MEVFFYFLIFIFGAAIGSFLGVIVDRLASKESIWKGRSHCDHCRRNLQAGDLIPILSFFLLGQKCRYCHKKLSWFYPLIECITGVSFVAASNVIFQQSGILFLQLSYQLLALYYFSLISCLIVIFFADLKYGIIPFRIVLFAFLLTLLWEIFLPYLAFNSLAIQLLGLQINILSIVLSAVVAGGFFFLIFVITKGRGMGFGDVVYAFLMGFILGYPLILAGLYLAFVTGAVISLLLVFLKKKKFRGGTIPFGPFLVFGTLVSLLYGTQLISWAMHFLTY